MKETLVFLPGMMCDHRLWSNQLACSELQQRFTIFIPEITALQKKSITEMASSILQQIKKTNFFAVGLSMGGIILMEMAKQAMQRIKGVVLADTNYKAELKERQLKRKQEIDLVKKDGLREFIIKKMKPNYLSPTRKDTKDIKNLVLQMALDLGESAFEQQSIALRDRQDYSLILKKITCLSLVLCGEDDALCPTAKHLEMQQLISKAELKIIKKAGHLSCLEEPEAFNSALLKYFSQLN